MYASDVLINVGCFLAAQSTVRTLESRCLPTFVTIMSQHGVSATVTVVALWTVKLAGVRVVLHIPLLRVLLQILQVDDVEGTELAT